VQLVVGEGVLGRLLGGGAALVGGEGVLDAIDQAGVGVGLGGAGQLADRGQRVAGLAVRAAGHEQRGGLADPLAIARGGDALGLGLGVQRAPERRRRLRDQRGLVAGPVDRVAQRGQLGGAIGGARGPGQVHAHRAGAIAGQAVVGRGGVGIAGGLGGARGA
jgi:hypothetical protein